MRRCERLISIPTHAESATKLDRIDSTHVDGRYYDNGLSRFDGLSRENAINFSRRAFVLLRKIRVFRRNPDPERSIALGVADRVRAPNELNK